jgi:hypothetical protein
MNIRNGTKVVERLLVRGHRFVAILEPLPCGQMPPTPDYLDMYD